MSEVIDLIGQKFKSWVVVSRAENYHAPSGGNAVRWLCRCEDCGAEKIVVSQVLRTGQIGTCKCHDTNNLVGQRFGKVVVLERAEDYISPSGFHSVSWLCLCDCGKEFVTRASCLKNGNTTSCGCGRGRDITGERFGRLVAIKKTSWNNGRDGHGCKWLFQCDCGNTVEYRVQDVTCGKYVSCGCREKETQQENKYKPTHGASDTSLYAIWCTMKARCYNENNQKYYRYGARGIKMCNDWKDSFESFQSWALTNGYSSVLSIDRIDNDGDYCPENCRWVNAYVQANNKSTNRYITYNSQTHTLSEWSRIVDIPYSTIYSRIYRLNWSIEDALTVPLGGKKK